ncbi:hypothetical protein [Oceanospirillum beijerinckii]|uniref:hypothetical protein n=1 Tax=Oceanospirillum beijerinckii TaxID=64976 RepID=UPI0004243297|nr:hypothetical protein [Oceanospirillum beijerinckii]
MSTLNEPQQPIRIVIEITQSDNGVVNADLDYSSNDEKDLKLKQVGYALTMALGTTVLPGVIPMIVNEIDHPTNDAEHSENAISH